jgi:hypothetical protein
MKRKDTEAVTPKPEVKGVITVFDKTGKVKSTMEITSVQKREDKQSGTKQHSS